MGKFKIGDKVRCVENGVASKPHSLGYKPGKEFVVEFINKTIDGDIYFAKNDNGVFECDLVLVKELPKSFACTNTNQKLWDKFIKWLDIPISGDINTYYGIHSDIVKYSDNISRSFDTILTLEEWDEIVNKTQTKKEETMKNYTITREQLQKIYDVACSGWKETILKYSRRNPFGTTIEFTQEEVVAMFVASSLSQRTVLEGIFGKQTKELDFQSDTINFEVDGISVFGISNMKSDESFIGLPRANHPNSFFLNPDYVWTLDDDVLKVTRK